LAPEQRVDQSATIAAAVAGSARRPYTREHGDEEHMTNADPRSGARTTRLGLVALGFVIGVIVTVLVMFMIQSR
jgi:hypothetical protein